MMVLDGNSAFVIFQFVFYAMMIENAYGIEVDIETVTTEKGKHEICLTLGDPNMKIVFSLSKSNQAESKKNYRMYELKEYTDSEIVKDILRFVFNISLEK